ncbi:MAG: MarR family transcriptional regulator [Chloroflexota bacterium]
MALSIYSDKESPAWRIIEHLQRRGSSTIKELEELLSVTTTAVRQHLGTLQADGYVERRQVNTGVGRPHHIYLITPSAQELFTCHCDDLALTLLQEIYALEGIAKTQLLLKRVGDRLADKYSESIQATVLQERVEELAGALNNRGVLTDVQEADNNTILLKTYNCPYHDLAQHDDEICQMDREMIRQVLGSDVELDSSIMQGDGCCSFMISGDRRSKCNSA